MNGRVQQLLDQMARLQAELEDALEERRGRLQYQPDGRKVLFDRAIQEAHERVRINVFRWLLMVRPQNCLTMPIIYGASIPLAFFDLTVSVYQAVCFPVYGIVRVPRDDYIVFDHQHLAYLNFFEKAHCLYCSYAVGMLAYTTEIIARTEQYFCPIKHARRVRGAHSRYAAFLDYGDGEEFQKRLEGFRVSLHEEGNRTPPRAGRPGPPKMSAPVKSHGPSAKTKRPPARLGR